MTAFYLSVVSGGVGADNLMADAQLFQGHLKKCFSIRALRIESVCEFSAIISLDTFNGIGKAFHTVLDELRGRIRAVFFKGFQIAKTAIFVNEGVLIIIPAVLLGLLGSNAYQAGTGDVFHIDLDFLSGIVCLFIRFGNVFGIWQLYSHLSSFPQKPV